VKICSGLVVGVFAVVLSASSAPAEDSGDRDRARNVKTGVEDRLYARLREEGQLFGRYFRVFVVGVQGRRLLRATVVLLDGEGTKVLVAQGEEGEIEGDLRAGAISLKLTHGTYWGKVRGEKAPGREPLPFKRRTFLVNQPPSGE